MLDVLANRTFRHLYAAQVLSLLGTGLTTVALGLLAYRIAGADAGAVLGTALAIKMLAYVFVSPVAGAFAARFERRRFLVTLDLCRAALVLLLPLVTEVWQVYVLVFLFQSFSAAFTPAFQATIPDVLVREADYTRALSLSRLAYDTESLLSPALAAALLALVAFDWLFVGTTLGFLASALLVLSVRLPARGDRDEPQQAGFVERVTRGTRLYLATPRLRGLLALSLAVSAGGAMVIVNTVVHVREVLGGTDQQVALFFTAYGLGSMVVALTLPQLLERVGDRRAMLAGAAVVVGGLLAAGALPGYVAGFVFWAVLGAGGSLIQTPAGRLLARTADGARRPALFAAHFALSHACWLLTYPLAGWLGATAGLPVTFVTLALLAAAAGVLAYRLWPGDDAAALADEPSRG